MLQHTTAQVARKADVNVHAVTCFSQTESSDDVCDISSAQVGAAWLNEEELTQVTIVQ